MQKSNTAIDQYMSETAPARVRRAGRGRKINDPALRLLAGDMCKHPRFAESLDHGASVDALREKLSNISETTKHINTLPGGRLIVRFYLRGRNVTFGYFSDDRIFDACRLADMITIKIWALKYQGALPPTEASFNFSEELANQDWTDYADTYGKSITQIMDRLQEIQYLTRGDKDITAKRASELTLETTAEMVRLFKKQFNERENSLFSLLEKIEARLANIEARLPGETPVRSDAPEAAPLGILTATGEWM